MTREPSYLSCDDRQEGQFAESVAVATTGTIPKYNFKCCTGP